MSARHRRDGEPKAPWITGAARFSAGPELNGCRLVLAARCRLGGLGPEMQALLDTGAQWSMVGGELAHVLEAEADDEALEITLSTRLGAVAGRLHRLSITLVADEGADLLVSSSVLLAPLWSGPPILGYSGFLERIRFGLDPGDGHDDQWLFFGSSQ